MIKLNYIKSKLPQDLTKFNVGMCTHCSTIFLVPTDLQDKLWKESDSSLWTIHRPQLTCCSDPTPSWILGVLLAEEVKED